jgi:dsDNA-specific endonuclease/ATPase MutS2
MANSSATVLEFGPLRDLLRGYTASDLGRARVAALAPSVDLAWIQNQQQLTSEVREFRRVGGNFDFAGLSDISKLLEKSRIAGAALETLEIRDDHDR